MKRTAIWQRTGASTIGLACCLHGCMMSATVYGQDEIVLAGQIRDFQSNHPDFGLSAGSGEEVTALVDYYLNAGGMVFTGAGEKLKQDALDGSSREIAPHLFALSPEQSGVFVLESTVVKENTGKADSYDPDVGYDGASAEDIPPLDTVSSIPPLSAPTMSVAKVSSYKYNKDGDFTVAAGDYWCDSWELLNNSTIVIDGDVRIRVDSNFRIRNGCTIYILPGGSLEIWTGGTVVFQQHTSINEDLTNALHFDTADDTPNWDHSNMRLYNFGTETIYFDNATDFKGTIVSPEAPVAVSNDAQIFGALTASGAAVDNTSGIHIAGEFVWEGECWKAADLQPALGVADTGDITSPMSFSTWFRDAPGINETDTHQLVMSDSGGAYTFKTSDWNPIDGELYGNEGQPGNRNFTVALQSIFLNSNCTNNFIEIATSMDAWVFIDDRLVIDLGGTTGSNRQRIELDRLGLATDNWYVVRVYIAHRTDGPQDLEITTTLPLTPPRDILFRLGEHHD